MNCLHVLSGITNKNTWSFWGWVVLLINGLLSMGCSPVKVPATHQYQLTAYSNKKVARHSHHMTLLVTTPEAATAYQTEQMFYIQKEYQLAPFVKNAWFSPPADMLHPLLMQSLQASGYFDGVVSSPYHEGGDYRLDTQLLALKQNFLKKPSVIELSAKVVLTRVKENEVLGSLIIDIQQPCPSDTPYGGVIAANQAAYQLTAQVVNFVVRRL